MSMLDKYKKAFDFLEHRSLREARKTFAEILAEYAEDQTALEFHSMLSRNPDEFLYVVQQEEPVVAVYKENEITPTRLHRIIQQAQETVQYLLSLPSMKPLNLFVLVMDSSLQKSNADYKKRPFVPKIRLNPSVHLGNISHEVAHLMFINSNRFLAEGFAMYVESHFTSPEVYFFQKALDEAFPDLVPLETLWLEHEERLCYFGANPLSLTLSITSVGTSAGTSSAGTSVGTSAGTSVGTGASHSTTVATSPYKTFLAYHEAGSFTHFLIKRYGWNCFLHLATEINQCFSPQDISCKIKEILHHTMGELEEEWQKEYFSVKTKESSRPCLVEEFTTLFTPLPTGETPTSEYTEWEEKLSDLEVSLCLQDLCSFAHSLSILQDKTKNFQGVFREFAGLTPFQVLQYYQARAALAMLNALELQLDWFYQEVGELMSTMAGFATLRDQCIQRIEEAISCLESMLKGAKEFSAAHRVLGELYGRAIKYKGKLSGISYGPKCERELNLAYKLDSQNVRNLTALGRLKLFTPKFWGGGCKIARKYFSQAMELQPLFHESYIGLALCSYMEKDEQECEGYLNQALELNNTNIFAQKLLARLKKKLPLART
jgi:tetratricopeptide (TPR) repeat protein